MFKGKKRINPNTTDTLIGEGSTFEGIIKSEASLRVEGKLNGDIECAGDVTVGEKGLVKSNISARNIVIAGTVQGNVKAKEKLMITSTGKLHGNTNIVKSFIIDEGGIFAGTSKMEATSTSKSDSSEKRPTDSPSKENYHNSSYNDSVANL